MDKTTDVDGETVNIIFDVMKKDWIDNSVKALKWVV